MTTSLAPQRVVTDLPWHRGKAARHLLSLRDIGPENLSLLVDRSLEFAAHGVGVPPLIGKTVGIYFKRTSTRTRTAFTVATIKLGATPIAYGPNDLQICSGETFQDTARVLAGYLDALVVRTNESIDEMRSRRLLSFAERFCPTLYAVHEASRGKGVPSALAPTERDRV